MIVKHKVILYCEVVHEIDEVEGLKSAEEFANNVGQLICEEAPISEGVAKYEIIGASRSIIPQSLEEKIRLKKFALNELKNQ